MVGLHVPLQVFKHWYVVTGTIAGLERLPNTRNYSASCYYKIQGDSLVVGAFENNPVPVDKVRKDRAMGEGKGRVDN